MGLRHGFMDGTDLTSGLNGGQCPDTIGAGFPMPIGTL